MCVQGKGTAGKELCRACWGLYGLPACLRPPTPLPLFLIGACTHKLEHAHAQAHKHIGTHVCVHSDTASSHPGLSPMPCPSNAPPACCHDMAWCGVACYVARYKRRLERVRVERDLESLAKQQEELGRLLAVYTKE